jgi:hypothetical protein
MRKHSRFSRYVEKAKSHHSIRHGLIFEWISRISKTLPARTLSASRWISCSRRWRRIWRARTIGKPLGGGISGGEHGFTHRLMMIPMLQAGAVEHRGGSNGSARIHHRAGSLSAYLSRALSDDELAQKAMDMAVSPLGVKAHETGDLRKAHDRRGASRSAACAHHLSRIF